MDFPRRALHFNVGLVVDLNKWYQLLLSTGRGFMGPAKAQVYLAYQIIFGP